MSQTIPTHFSVANTNPLLQTKQATQAASDNQAGSGDRSEVRQAFDAFVGETFFSQLLGAMRQTVGKPSYFHGGRAEEVFRSQLDQTFAEQLANTTAPQLTEPMFEMFELQRR